MSNIIRYGELTFDATEVFKKYRMLKPTGDLELAFGKTVALFRDHNGIIYCITEDGISSRELGPAYIERDGSRVWYKDGDKHRLDGAAVISHNFGKEYWIDGWRYTYDAFIKDGGKDATYLSDLFDAYYKAAEVTFGRNRMEITSDIEKNFTRNFDRKLND